VLEDVRSHILSFLDVPYFVRVLHLGGQPKREELNI